MSYSAAFLIFLICSAMAVVVAAPFLYLARRWHRRGSSQKSVPASRKMTPAQAIPGLLLVALMFFAFAHQFIAPNSWLGSRVTTGEGRFWFSVLIFLIFLVLNYIWITFRRRKPKSDPD
jgi:protein-S-isoprenylcysteine O-methyltransferase Ste14